MFDSAALRWRALYKPVKSYLGETLSPVYRNRYGRADVLIVWFPKTGGTWTRLLLHRAMARHFGIEGVGPLNFEGLYQADHRVPRIHAFHEDEPHWKRPDQLATDKSKYRDKKVILLARDPRDAMVSHYFQMTKRFRVVDPEMTIGEFLEMPSGSLRTWIRYYNIWARNREVPRDLHLIRYEDVHADPAAALRQVLEFVGVDDVDDAIIDESVAHNDIGRTREREKAGAYQHRQLTPGIEGDPDSFKARRGKAGGYVDYLSPEEIQRVDELVRAELDPWYGYPWEGDS